MIIFSDIRLEKFLTPDLATFVGMVAIFLLVRYLLSHDIQSKRLQKDDGIVSKKKTYFLSISVFLVFLSYAISLYLNLDFLTDIVRFSFSVAIVYLVSLFIHRKILILYGQEVEVSGQTYFRKGYTVNIFSLFINATAVLICIFLSIQIFNLDNFVAIGGLWAGILAFMGFTAPVWALDMVAGIILLHSKTIEVGNVVYIYERDTYTWIKDISLTEVKMIDLRTGNPIIFRPSTLRNLTLKNLSQGISGKTHSLLREIEIHIAYKEPRDNIEKLCYEAFDEMIIEAQKNHDIGYFGEEPFRSLEVSSFGDDAVHYKFFYTISSPFFLFKAERLLNEYLLKYQVQTGIYFATPKLLEIKKETI